MEERVLLTFNDAIKIAIEKLNNNKKKKKLTLNLSKKNITNKQTNKLEHKCRK